MRRQFSLEISKLRTKLIDNGYFIYFPKVGNYSHSFELLKAEGKIVEIVKPISAFPLIEQCLIDEPNPETISLLKQSLFEEEAEWHEILTSGLDLLMNDFLVDTPNESYFFFEKTGIKVTEGEFTQFPYSSLKRFVWKNQIIKHNITLENLESVKESAFYKYIQGASSFSVQYLEDQLRSHLISFAGCLLHNGEENQENRLLFLTDSTAYFNNEESRKSILLQAIGKLTCTIFLDGSKHINENALKKKLLPETKLIVIDNVTCIDLQILQEFLTSNPGLKICVISKYPLLEESKFQYCFISGFSSEPLISNPNEYFDDWSPSEWNSFYSLMIYSTQYYLHRGLSTSPNTGAFDFDKLLSLTSPVFFHFMNSTHEPGVEYSWEQVLDDYFHSSQCSYSGIEMSGFQIWVEAYADYKNYEIIHKENIAESLFLFKELPPVRRHIR